MPHNRSNQKIDLWENSKKDQFTKAHLKNHKVYGNRSYSSATERQVLLEKDVAVDTSI